VLVTSLKTGDTLYSQNARRLLMPASNMKIVTLAAAAERLGWDYAYETKVLAGGPVAGGVLEGDIVIVGSGDPSLMAADGMAERVFAGWAERLSALGVRTIAGRIVGDDRAFESQTLGFGWSWDDLPDDYAAGVGALQFNENMARVTVMPGPSVADAAGVAVEPVGGLTIVSEVVTGARGSPTSISTHRLPGSMRLELRGSIALGDAPRVETVSVDRPTQFFVNAVRTALIARGIDVRGPAVDAAGAGTVPPSAALRSVDTYRSPPLSTLAVRLMKVSQNQYAETLLKTMSPAGAPASALAGGVATQTLVEGWGVAPGALILRDGSGLSRYDYVTPEAIVTILTHIDKDQRLRGPFEASLPIGGRDGGIGNRMKGTPAEGNARAKTGSMSNVRALSGYLNTADGEPLAFSIIANNFETAAVVVNRATDAIVVRLAQFKR
jgi:D-alanyl-D-alanine carboxypeptidase/D-alanyl-D-alanine-endopeptidase (penicillin-binding protein 4)